MKKISLYLIGLLIIFLTTHPAIAAENLDAWGEYYEGGVVIDVNGSAAAFDILGTGGEDFGKIYETFSGALGVKAQMSVSETSAPNNSNAMLRLRQYVGLTPENYKIQAGIGLQNWNDRYRIWYEVKVRDQQGNTVNVLAKGFLGDTSNMWDLGEEVVVGLLRRGKDIIFFTPKNDALVKVQPLVRVEDLNDRTTEVTGYGKDGGTMSGIVRNVTILY